MNLPRRSRAALPAVCLALAATPCFAQTAPAAQPPPAPTGAPAEPPAAPPTPAPAPAPVWETPAPLPEGARVQRPPPPRFDVEPGPARGFPGAARECPDTQRVGRIVAETLAASAVTTASVLVGMFAQDASGSGQQALGTLGALVMYITVTPAAVGLVGRTFGGNGRYWAALLGGVLLPVAGHVLGYELSHDPECDDAPTRVTLRGGRRLPAAVPVRVAPVVAPNLAGAGGATAGLTITF